MRKEDADKVENQGCGFESQGAGWNRKLRRALDTEGHVGLRKSRETKGTKVLKVKRAGAFCRKEKTGE